MPTPRGRGELSTEIGARSQPSGAPCEEKLQVERWKGTRGYVALPPGRPCSDGKQAPGRAAQPLPTIHSVLTKLNGTQPADNGFVQVRCRIPKEEMKYSAREKPQESCRKNAVSTSPGARSLCSGGGCTRTPPGGRPQGHRPHGVYPLPRPSLSLGLGLPEAMGQPDVIAGPPLGVRT